MNSKEIVAHVSKWFGAEMSPGQVFDDLIYVRKQGVKWEDVTSAILNESKAIDENDDPPLPARTVGRNRPAPFQRPAPPPAPPKPTSGVNLSGMPDEERCERPSPKAFSNPKFSFGEYAGKTILEVIQINPGYVKRIADGKEPGMAEFWITQAKLAQFKAAVIAPAYHDTDSTGFLA